MIDHQDFSMEGEDPVPTDQPVASPPPRVVIEYRDRGFHSLLIPPLLILLSVLVILSSRRGTPILAPTPTPIVSQTEPSPPSPPPAVTAGGTTSANAKALEPPAPAPALAPILRTAELASALPDLPDLDELMPPASMIALKPAAPSRTETSADSTAVPASEPSADPEAATVPESLPVAQAQVPSAPQTQPAAGVNKIQTPMLIDEPNSAAASAPAPVAADPAPEVTREQVLEEIRDEAARKAAEIRKIEDLRPHIRELELRRMIKKAEANRVAFHKALRELLKTPRPEIGRDIEALCNEYGRTALPEIRAKINKALATTYARSTLKNKVEMMRVWGLPEPMVFDYVANDSYRHLGARGGPRDGDEVGVRAARILLSIPPVHPTGRSIAGSVAPARPAAGPKPH